MTSIHTNITALTGQQNQRKSQSDLSTAMERLSSGLRINSAKDDAAGLAISNRMETNLRANDAVSKGLNDGISLMQTAEGALDGINGLLQRGRQLALQAASDTLSSEDRSAIHNEFLQIVEEVDRIAMDTQAFEKHLLAPTSQRQEVTELGNTKTIKNALQVAKGAWDNGRSSGTDPIGFIPKGTTNLVIEINSLGADDDIQLFTRNGAHLVGTPMVEGDSNATDATWTARGITTEQDMKDDLLNEANGFSDQVAYDGSSLFHNTSHYDATGGATRTVAGMEITYSGDGDWHDNVINDGNNSPYPSTAYERVLIQEVKEPLFLAVTGSGSYDMMVDWDHMPDGPPKHPTSTPTDIVMSANSGDKANKLTIEPTPADSQTLGLDEISLSTGQGASAALGALDDALAKVDEYRSHYGALNNRFDSAIDNLTQQSISTEAAQSRILDADYAVETANMMKVQILQQAGQSLLAQANQLPQTALTLLG
ncbi:flagellin [Halomonas sp. NO4]|uniref:flagellin N-terminal helical domain-containing protein n=1 Tax=Halomonas sp. NO4 TaxID=2484813 RepID=UPI0013CFBFAF|nr:flagellin [Halomonas sp. NO4]